MVALFKTKGAQKGDKLRGVWIADNVGDAAPANTKIDEKTSDPGRRHQRRRVFVLKNPTKGWPAGKYHLDIYVNDKLATTEKFTIEASEKAEKTTEKEVNRPMRTQYAFKVHNDNVQRITQLLTSEEDGKVYGKFDIGKGIDVGETVTLNWDKSTNKSDCHWSHQGGLRRDKSGAKAVKFDFCEEGLIVRVLTALAGTMRAILRIFAMALIAFGIHLASFALIPSTRGPSVRVSHAVLGVAGNVVAEIITSRNTTPQGEYPRGSLHANAPRDKAVLIVFWSLVYVIIFSLLYFVFARIGRSRVPRESSRATPF